MFVEERHQKILELLRQQGNVSVESLSATFAVSLPTIRTDLAVLDQRGLLKRTHGGAIIKESRQQNFLAPPERRGSDEKRRIAQLAAARVKDGETILLDAGTTVLEIARILQKRSSLIVVTNSLSAALELKQSAGVAIVFVGGDLHKERQATFGPLAIEFLRDIHVDRAFIGVNGVSEDAGYTVVDFDAVHLKRTMIARAREVIVVADHSKLGEATFASIGPLTSAQALVTDIPIHNPNLQFALETAGVEVIQAES